MLTQETRSRLAIGASMENTLNPLSRGSVMFLLGHYLQVAGVVIRAVAVDVVNNFIGGKWAAEHFFGNKPVLIKAFLAHPGNQSVTVSRNMAAFPVGVIFTVQAFNFALREVRLLQLRQSRLAQGFVAKRPVFSGGHSMLSPKMSSTNLHTANKAAQFTSNGVFHDHVLYCEIVRCAN